MHLLITSQTGPFMLVILSVYITVCQNIDSSSHLLKSVNPLTDRESQSIQRSYLPYTYVSTVHSSQWSVAFERRISCVVVNRQVVCSIQYQ